LSPRGFGFFFFFLKPAATRSFCPHAHFHTNPKQNKTKKEGQEFVLGFVVLKK
jgi:hypothetical protein